jgi:hypothetical protein
MHTDPLEGVLLARFFKRSIIIRALKAIPKEVIDIAVAHEGSIWYFEACKLTRRVGILSNAVYHIEPTSMRELLRKYYQYGKFTKKLVKTGHYYELVKRKNRFRKGSFNPKYATVGIPSIILTLLKGIAFMFGYLAE